MNPAIPIPIIGGTGLMGLGIAEHLLVSGFKVIIVGRRQRSLDDARHKLYTKLRTLVERKQLSVPLHDAILDSRLSFALGVESLRGSRFELVIESISEDLQLKLAQIAELEAVLPDTTILATNTSALSPTALSTRPRFAALHFFNPATAQKAIELSFTPNTTAETIVELMGFCAQIGRNPVLVADSVGYIVNRYLFPPINDAYRMLGEELVKRLANGAVSPAEIEAAKYQIDRTIRQGAGLPMGPFELAKFVGLTVVVAILRQLRDRLGFDFFEPHPLLLQEEEAQRLAAAA